MYFIVILNFVGDRICKKGASLLATYL